MLLCHKVSEGTLASASVTVADLTGTYHFPVSVTELPDRAGELLHLWSGVDHQRPCHKEVSGVRLAGTVETVTVSRHPCFSAPLRFSQCYHKISADGRLLHSIEGALLRGEALEVEYGLHQWLAGFRVPVSHHEELLVWFVILRFLGAWRIVNIWYHHDGVKSFRVAGIGNVIWVWGGLRMDKIAKLID